MWHNLNIIRVSRTTRGAGTWTCTCRGTWIWSWLGWRFRTATRRRGPTLVGAGVWTSTTINRININTPGFSFVIRCRGVFRCHPFRIYYRLLIGNITRLRNLKGIKRWNLFFVLFVFNWRDTLVSRPALRGSKVNRQYAITQDLVLIGDISGSS